MIYQLGVNFERMADSVEFVSNGLANIAAEDRRKEITRRVTVKGPTSI